MKARVAGMAGMAIAVLLTVAPAAFAEDPKGWSAEITPYAWLAGLEGDVTIDGVKTEFDKSFSELFDAVEFASGLLGTVRHDRYVAVGQVDFFALSTDALDVEDRPQGGELDSDMLILEMGAGYQLDGWSEGQTFDLLLGLRHLHAENDLEVYGDQSYSKDSDITDPMVAVRPSIRLFPSKIDGLRFNGFMAIGGGGDSGLIYELHPQLQYEITDLFGARLGYRRIGFKFEGEGNDNEMNMSLAGLLLGVDVTF